MKKIRFGVIGMGAMGVGHARSIKQAASRRFSLAAVCDSDPSLKAPAEELAVPFFADAQEMYDSGLIDAVVISVPHYWHAPLTFRAARAGIHVLCEKPLASDIASARAMVAECRKRRVALGAMFQQRRRPAIVKMKQLLDRGAIGELFRTEVICSKWFRTQAYYDSCPWRGTWDGEGGGVLMNQAPHSLDLFQWLGMGLPKTIVANVATREHKIECEDTANVICDYGQGRIGYIYASTAEEPGIDRLTLTGDKGVLTAEEGKRLTLGKLKIPISRHVYSSKKSSAGGAEQKLTVTEVKVGGDGGKHIEAIAAFAGHLLKGTPMVATGKEALVSLEIANAAYLSGYSGSKPVKLPIDGAAVNRLLNRLIRQKSTGKGGGMRKATARDMRAILSARK